MDLQREIPGNIAVSVGYVGSRSENLTWSGTVNGALNINQIPSQHLALGSALNTPVANPFLGTPLARGALSGATVTRGQLLRPFPQFTDVNMRRSSGARSVYNSAVFRFERRINNGWGARLNYTFSKTKDNQVQEESFFGRSSLSGQRYLDVYNLDSEYTLSVNDQPHRFNLALTYELPAGEGKRWLNEGVGAAILGGWAVTAVGTYASGYPISVYQDNNNTNLFGGGQRPNVVSGVEPAFDSPEYDDSCSCLRWLNPAAWTSASAFTFGNAPRTDDRVRTPFKKNVDIAFQKTHRFSGKSVMVRFEMINAFNDANFVGPFVGFGLGNFGQVTEVGGFPRLLQLMIRFGF